MVDNSIRLPVWKEPVETEQDLPQEDLIEAKRDFTCISRQINALCKNGETWIGITQDDKWEVTQFADIKYEDIKYEYEYKRQAKIDRYETALKLLANTDNYYDNRFEPDKIASEALQQTDTTDKIEPIKLVKVLKQCRDELLGYYESDYPADLREKYHRYKIKYANSLELIEQIDEIIDTINKGE